VAQQPPKKPSHKPHKQLTANDLNDPLMGDLRGSRDVPMASADDLLSEIVGDDVERLMSGEFEPVRGHSPTAGRKPVEQLQHQLGNFLEELRHRERAAPPAEPHRIHEDDLTSPLDDLVAPSHEELEALHSGEYEPAEPATPHSTPFARTARGPAESAALLAPVNAFEGESTYLRSLDWMSGPIARMSGKGRVAVSLLAIASFLGGCAALGYVLMLRYNV
jgi:hypothetical protein